MPSRVIVRLGPSAVRDLARDWSRLLRKVNKARRRCHRSMDEGRVHDLRVSCRKAMPVLEILRMMDPDEARWSGSYREVRHLLRALGPLRDIQVRENRIERMELPGGLARALRRCLRSERKGARARASSAVESTDDIPVKAVKEAFRGDQRRVAERILRAVNAVLQRRRDALLSRWSAIDRQRPRTVHRARVALKRYRYLLMAIARCTAGRIPEPSAGLKKLQNRIGVWRDDRLLRAWSKAAGKPGARLLEHMGRQVPMALPGDPFSTVR